MSIAIQPLPGHPIFFQVQEGIRSTRELLGNPQQRTIATETVVLLPHPPVLQIHEGGGEKLLNRDAVTAQLSYQRHPQPANLRVWIIDSKSHNRDAQQLLAFIFGPIQRMYYQKSNGNKTGWKMTMELIEKDPHLKGVIETNLFDSKRLGPRHYRILLSPAQLSESSITHELGKIRKSCKNETVIETQSPQPDAMVMVNNPCESGTSELPSDTVTEETRGSENNFDMAASLEKISQAAQRGAKHFALLNELEGN